VASFDHVPIGSVSVHPQSTDVNGSEVITSGSGEINVDHRTHVQGVHYNFSLPDREDTRSIRLDLVAIEGAVKVRVFEGERGDGPMIASFSGSKEKRGQTVVAKSTGLFVSFSSEDPALATFAGGFQAHFERQG
jgi:hypothetical protein